MELLVRGGRDPVHAKKNQKKKKTELSTDMDPAVRAFYEFHACLMEPWDGPAALAFTDGVLAGSALDRNGLRPCRYKITEDGLVIAASEVGVADLEPESVVENGRLGPGELLVVDTDTGSILRSAAARQSVAQRHHYAGWVERMVQDLPADAEPITNGNESDLIRRQRAFGYGFEDLRYVLGSMAGTGLDAVWSMGDDTPIPPLSRFAHTLYAYFRQRFAQVTNPAIDPLRETRVMSLTMYLGRRGSVLAQRPTPSAHPLLRLPHPILLDEEMSAVRQAPGFTVATVDAVWPVARRASGLKSPRCAGT
jgi:hypothetical protein